MSARPVPPVRLPVNHRSRPPGPEPAIRTALDGSAYARTNARPAPPSRPAVVVRRVHPRPRRPRAQPPRVDVDIPRDRIVAFTGVSGSGKSSLAFGTVFAEAQRRFLESVAPYAPPAHRAGQHPARRRLDHGPAAGRRPAAAPWRPEHPFDGRHADDPEQLRPHALLAPRHLPRGRRAAVLGLVLAEHRDRGVPALPRARDAHEVTEASAVHDPSLSIRDGAITAWPGAWQGKNLRDVTAVLGYDIDRPWRDLRRRTATGCCSPRSSPSCRSTRSATGSRSPTRGGSGAPAVHAPTLADSQSEAQRNKAMRFVESGPCQLCGGSGLSPARPSR